MSTADSRDDSGLVRQDVSSWRRRDFLSAVGAGAALVSGFGHLPRSRAPLSITFHGVLLITKSSNGDYEILMPKANAETKFFRHLDSVPARFHQAWLYNKKTTGVSEEIRTEIKGASLLIDAGGTPTVDLGAMFDLDEATDGFGRMRLQPFADATALKAHYIGRITLRGGTSLKAMHHSTDGGTTVWQIPETDIEEKWAPANMIMWETNKNTLEVKTSDGQTFAALDGAKHSNVQVGHLTRDPEKWETIPPEDELSEGFVDHDFKWLYRILVPQGQEAAKNPWKVKLKKNKMLRAPAYLRPGLGTGVGTPTCFGGCFGCT